MKDYPVHKKVILCADDFGISPGVNEGICRLAEEQRISAVSVMVIHNNWMKFSDIIKRSRRWLDVGLHFTLTASIPVAAFKHHTSLTGSNRNFFDARKLFLKTCLNKINPADVVAEIKAQWDSFVQVFGFEPDFIDGHQHIHQYPIIRDAVIEFVCSLRSRHQNIYVRNARIALSSILAQKTGTLKMISISALGNGLKRLLESRGVSTNLDFGGVYNLNHPELFEDLLVKGLARIKKVNGVIMVHPGFPDHILKERDCYTEGRKIEFDVLSRSSTLAHFEELNISLSRFDFNADVDLD